MKTVFGILNQGHGGAASFARRTIDGELALADVYKRAL